MRGIEKEFIVLSAELSSLGIAENFNRTKLLKEILIDLNLDFLETKGYYKDKNGLVTNEQGFLVLSPNESTSETLRLIAFGNFNQESILYRYHDRTASLIYSSGEVTSIGRWREVPNINSLKPNEGFTYIKKFKRAFQCA